ncbi:Glycosyltransferase, GT2 family [Paraburkholderia sartisoli]|uniref:Glycosyltransferase, GT2 family n=1 Tax=Paraburkholderia sartisoli TaxID=83784 RepID=A0A1H4EDN5_9BURK|nr:Glycosyltransferase, GT2 family [Paraburkholderia sartisoli]
MILFHRGFIVKVSVIVPTWRRTADLARCVAALCAQTRRVDELVVVARAEDHASLQWLEQFQNTPHDTPLRVALVREPGVVAAYNRGIEASTGDIVGFTDDDAAPHADWVERIVAAFARDPLLGGFGGRDIVHERNGILTGEKQAVGVVSWYGRAVGNHHIGVGEPRDVQILKAVNMAFRRQAIGAVRFDPRLRGSGAQVHCEMAFCLDVMRRGWKLIYDPTLLVEHYPAQRSDEDQRYTFNDTAFYNASFNLRLIMCEHLPPLGRGMFVVYASLIGNRADPGLARALSLVLAGESLTVALRKWWVGLRAMRGAWREAMRQA